MTGSHQTTTSGPVRTSPRRTKVGESTAKVRKRSNTSESRRNLNGRPRGREIATIPYPTVHVHTDDEEDDHLQKPMGKEIVSSTEGATKRKKRPAGKKKKRVPEVHGSTYDDDTDKGDDDDGKLLADQVVRQNQSRATAVERIDERQPTRRKQIVSSTEGAMKRKKRPGKKNKGSARGTRINVR